MKHHTTKILKILASCLMSAPISYLLCSAILFDIPPHHCIHILLSPLYCFTVILTMITGYGLWEMRRWSWYVFMVTQILIAYENSRFAIHFSESHHKFLVYIISVLIQMLLIYQITQEVRVPYFFPKIRWWESNPHYRLSEEVSIIRKNNEIISGKILDIALTGCFIQAQSSFQEEELIVLKSKLFEIDLLCRGSIVWIAQSTVTHPRGIGVKFELLDRTQKRKLRSIHRILKQIASLYRSSRYWLSEEDFFNKIKQAQKQELTKIKKNTPIV